MNSQKMGGRERVRGKPKTRGQRVFLAPPNEDRFFSSKKEKERGKGKTGGKRKPEKEEKRGGGRKWGEGVARVTGTSLCHVHNQAPDQGGGKKRKKKGRPGGALAENRQYTNKSNRKKKK